MTRRPSVDLHMRWTRIAAIFLIASVAAAVSIKAGGESAIAIGVKDRANANASMTASGTFVGVVWAARTKDGVTDMYTAMSRDSGRSFRAPVRVNQTAGDVSVCPASSRRGSR